MEVLEGKRSAKEQEGVNLATPSIEQMFKDMFKGGDVSMCPFLNMQKKKKKKEPTCKEHVMADPECYPVLFARFVEDDIRQHVLDGADEYPLLAARMAPGCVKLHVLANAGEYPLLAARMREYTMA